MSSTRPWCHQNPSPYAPTSRLFLNLCHVAVPEVPGADLTDLSDLADAGEALNSGDRIDRARVLEAWEDCLAAPDWAGDPVWIHGDLLAGNLLVHEGRLSAVIDFGALGLGDPAVDLIAAWQFVTAEHRDAFRARLGVDDATWARGRGWGLVAVLPTPSDLADDSELAVRHRRRLDEVVADLTR